jgi:hypothetical protein
LPVGVQGWGFGSGEEEPAINGLEVLVLRFTI